MAARHEEIAEKLRRAIDREDYAVGSPLPTEADLAARYGISRGTGRQAVAALTVEVLQGSPQGLRRVTLTSRHSQSLPSCAALEAVVFPSVIAEFSLVRDRSGASVGVVACRVV
ncbi:GntR family transcriptional regulator, partial [Streptomyces lydicus]|uniref:GntR family transcriptional regulator n=1 Tax=Streptomyces lydicus TaxID=47763 RepID=UPI0037B079D5